MQTLVKCRKALKSATITRKRTIQLWTNLKRFSHRMRVRLIEMHLNFRSLTVNNNDVAVQISQTEFSRSNIIVAQQHYLISIFCCVIWWISIVKP